MDFKRIDLSHKELFKQRLSGREHEIINFNFTSLFMFQDWTPYLWAEVEDTIVIKGERPGFVAFTPPISPDDRQVVKATHAIIQWFQESGLPFLMTEVTDSYLKLLTQEFPGKFKVEEFRKGANYIYKTTDLACLKGRKYSSKRNHIHHFFRDYPDSRLVPLTKELIPECLDVMETWYNTKDTRNEDMKQERISINSALAHFGELDYTGACLMAGNKIAAFTLGEPVNSSTVGILVEKADYSYHGSFAVINNLFINEYWLDYPYINRDEDMGDEGMRTAKNSYHPCRLNMKYNLRLKEDL